MRMIIMFIGVLLVAVAAYGADKVSDYDTALYGPRAIVDPDMQKTIDSWFKGAPTNGMICAISFAPTFEKGSPIIYVHIVDVATNYIRGILRIPIENRANIELLDSNGRLVPKTDEGKKFGVWTDQQMRDWFEDNREKPPRFPWSIKSERDTKGIADILFPLLDTQVSVGISLPELFEIKQAGEYTLHFQMKVAQTKVDEAKNIKLSLFWLPEVIVKVHVRPEDIAPTNSIPNGQTNSPAK